ncbi:proline-rich receptor-like protein kinase PERK2 [Iris pallida]|uniref:Proline-rich receptor-like protein kinase PERK2 n=1 Tax=Iris pallida TaxID=29817 RepID=A0AAX6FM29_IRIPA|nr:proline-rich receptor-like protein kinase PERK2 [Iris pallida]
MSERPPSSHISCHSRQANQSRVRTRVSVYFPSYSTGLQASKPRVRVDRPTRTLHHPVPKFPTTSPRPPQTLTSRSRVLTPHLRAGEPLRSSVRRDLRPCVAEPPSPSSPSGERPPSGSASPSAGRRARQRSPASSVSHSDLPHCAYSP